MIHKRLVGWAALPILCAAAASAQGKVDKRLMSDAEYKSFLNELEAKLPIWEAALKRVDPAKTNMSYSDGEKLVQQRNLALYEIGLARTYVEKERIQRRVSQELALRGFIEGVFNAIGDTLLYGLSIDVRLEQFGPEISRLLQRIANDVQARVELLEKGTCP